MKKLFLVLSLVTVFLASCCNNNQKSTQKCDGNHEQKCEQTCDGKHDHQNCDKQCESINHDGCQVNNNEACPLNHQECVKQCDSTKQATCEKQCDATKAECEAKKAECEKQCEAKKALEETAK